MPLVEIATRVGQRRCAMESLETLKDRSTYYAINKIIDLLSSASVERFISLTYWGEKLSSDPEVRASIQHPKSGLDRLPRDQK